MAICEKCIKKSVCRLCDGSEIMGCIEFVGRGSNVLTTDQNEVKLLVEIPKSLYEAAFEGRYTRYDSLNCIKAIRDGQVLPDDCEILTKEAYADLCMRASKCQEPNCSEILTGSEKLSSELEKNSKKLEKDFGELDCISRQAVLEQAYAYGNGLEPDGYCVNVEDIQALPSVTPQQPIHGKCNQCKYYEGVHNVQGHAPCTYHRIGSVMWDWYCSQFDGEIKE